jgi:hyperosmotically inducible periplasmic protein
LIKTKRNDERRPEYGRLECANGGKIMNIIGVKKLLGSALGVVLLAGGFAAAQQMSKQQEEKVIRLANDVRKKLLMLTNYGPFDYLSFGIGPADKGYKVILKGYASRPLLKSDAEKEVKRIEAVDVIDNQIEVLPTSNNDENIRLKTYTKIYYNTSLSRYNPNYGAPVYGSSRSFRNTAQMGISTNPPMGIHPISIIVKNGHVILEGVVDNEMDKTMAGMQANQVNGVFSVTNNLVVLQASKKKKG